MLIHAFPLNLQLTNTSNTKKVCICKHVCTHRDMCTGNKFYGTILTENSYIKYTGRSTRKGERLIER